MGFKCPICLKDFAINKSAWEKHIKFAHDGVGNSIVDFVRCTAEQPHTAATKTLPTARHVVPKEVVS